MNKNKVATFETKGSPLLETNGNETGEVIITVVARQLPEDYMYRVTIEQILKRRDCAMTDCR